MNHMIKLLSFIGLSVLLFTCTTPLLAHSKKGLHTNTPLDYLPKQFALYIESGKERCEITWNGKVLQYFTFPLHFGLMILNVKEVSPSPQTWKRFWKEMDAIHLWQWLREDTGPLLSPTWGMMIQQPGKNGKTKIIPHSSNYPSDTDVSKPTQRDRAKPPERSQVFVRYVTAVHELLGDEKLKAM